MNETLDFVAVGGGGAMCAALVLRAAGKSVLILEKGDLVGSTTAIAGGVMWIPNNRFMKQEGVPDSRDEDFHRGEHAYEQWMGDPLKEQDKSLGAIETGPFYAVPLYPGDVSTFGGLVTDIHARVLRPDGSVIPGLYATGTSTASVMGGVQPLAGGSIGPSFTWGYVVAKHAMSTS